MIPYNLNKAYLKRISALLIKDLNRIQMETLKATGKKITLVEASRILSRRLKSGER